MSFEDEQEHTRLDDIARELELLKSRVSASDGRNSNKEGRRSMLESGALILAIAGLVWYSTLNLIYGQFYGALGIGFGDVGLGYTNILATSVGTAIPIILLATVTAYTGVRESRGILRKSSETLDQESLGELRREFLMIDVTFVLLAMLAVGLFLGFKARSSADAVKRGDAVRPYSLLTPALPILPMQANPALVEATGEAAKSIAIKNLNNDRLLYMGQSNGIVVVYDSKIQQTIYLPQSAIVLRVANCSSAKSPNPPCNI